LRKAVPDQWEAALAIYREQYESLFISSCIKAFPGLDAALNLLKSKGLRTAIVTGKSSEGTAFSLMQARLMDLFDIVLTGSPDGEVKRDHLNQVLCDWKIPSETVFYLGDLPSDIRDAHSVGMIALGAAWAEKADRVALEQQSPEVVFTDIEQFVDWLKDHTERTSQLKHC
jgi:phosphoglycolate phosphatase-like HAD superfamily hydrolase